MDEIELYNAEEVACNFYDWLVQHDSCDTEDKFEDLEDMVKDFYTLQETAPKLFNLLRCMSD